jgi:flagellar assembly factor FliW
MLMSSETLQLKTTRFGTIEVPAASVIDICAGIIGFPSYHTFVLLDYRPPFSWLQSVENPDLAFVVVNAAEFGENYDFSLPTNDRELDLKEDDEVAIFNLVSVRPDPSLTTVNLKAPVVVNLRNRRGRQLILDDPRYPTRMPLWGEKEEGK